MATIVKTPAGTWKAVVRKTGWPTNAKLELSHFVAQEPQTTSFDDVSETLKKRASKNPDQSRSSI